MTYYLSVSLPSFPLSLILILIIDPSFGSPLCFLCIYDMISLDNMTDNDNKITT